MSCSLKGKIKRRHVREALCESGNHMDVNDWCRYYFSSPPPMSFPIHFQGSILTKSSQMSDLVIYCSLVAPDGDLGG